jgi:hypothetical protein
MASTYIYRTPSSTGSNTISTFSAWLKKQVNGSYEGIFTSVYETGEYFQINFEPGNALEVRCKVSSSYVLRKITSRKFRDNSAFYHIVVTIDTTDSTAEDRVKIYVNGTRETSFSTNTNPSSSQNLTLNTAGSYQHRLGRDEWSTPAYFDGIMAHVHWVDGTAYQASTFGETDSTSGIWVPKTAPSVTYGTNGFFLKFENSGNMDLDSSGNNLTFATTGTLTQNVDTPSNNFATGNPIHVDGTSASAFINGNLTHTNNVSAVSSLAINKGKWYMEFKRQDNGGSITNWMYCGFAKADRTGLRLYRSSNGDYYNGSSYSSYGASWSDGDIVGVALDYDNDTIEFYKNGTSQGSKTSIGICDGDYVLPIWQCSQSSGSPYFHANFGSGFFGTTAVASANADANGQGAFEYAVPSGYYALNTKNLKEFG